MDVHDFVILVVSLVVIAVTANIVITLKPSSEHPKVLIWEFLGKFKSYNNDSKDNKRDNMDNNDNTKWYYF